MLATCCHLVWGVLVFGLKVRQRAFVTLQRKAHIAVIPVTISHAQLKVNKL